MRFCFLADCGDWSVGERTVMNRRLIMWHKVKGLRLDPAAYANLNKENMGMLTNI